MMPWYRKMLGKKKKKRLYIREETEYIYVNPEEHKELINKRHWLESHFDVKIHMPRTESMASDILLVQVKGEAHSINYVKIFLANFKREKLAYKDGPDYKKHDYKKHDYKKRQKHTTHHDKKLHKGSRKFPYEKNNIDYERRNNKSSCHKCSKNGNKNPPKFAHRDSTAVAYRDYPAVAYQEDPAVAHREDPAVAYREDPAVAHREDPAVAHREDPAVAHQEDPAVCVPVITLSDSESEKESQETVCELEYQDIKPKTLPTVKSKPFDNIISLNNPRNSSHYKKIDSHTERKAVKVRSQRVSASGTSDLYEVTRTTEDKIGLNKKKCLKYEPAEEFIPLISEDKSENQNKSTDNRIVSISDHPSLVPCNFRPIVIDGSNIAMEHGRTSHTYSVKGIQLAVDYFLNRGCHQVTAFVPKFRRSGNPSRRVVSTNVDLFDELERKQHVVFTPSRTVDGEIFSSYSHRFIVEYAASYGGIIVSNDNFRDLLHENESFKEAIVKRLLMYCIVGDIFMVPDDPLGRNGPRLKEFLCFPPEDMK